MNQLVDAAPWVAYLGALTAFATLIRSWGGLKKQRADAAKTLIDSSVGVVRTLREECDALEKDLAESRKTAVALGKDLAAAQAEIADLRGQVDRMSKDLAAAHAEAETLRAKQGGTA